MRPERTEQFNIKLRPRELEMVREAARLQGRYVTELFRDNALREAKRVLKKERTK